MKGRFNLNVPDFVKPSSIPEFGLCSEETGSTNRKKLNIQTFPHTHSAKRHQRFCLWIHTIWAYFGCNQRVSSSVFQRSPIIIVVDFGYWELIYAQKISLWYYFTMVLDYLEPKKALAQLSKVNILSVSNHIYLRSPGLLKDMDTCHYWNGKLTVFVPTLLLQW